jgi:hypothetical protein
MLTDVSEDILSPTSTLRNDVAYFPETLVTSDLTTWRHISEDGSLQVYSFEPQVYNRGFYKIVNI